MTYDGVGAEESPREFLRRACRRDVFRADIDEVAYFELRGRNTVLVSLDLVAGLSSSDVGAEMGMEFVEVHCELTSAGGGQIALRVDSEVGVIALVGEEGRDSGGGVGSVVVRELRKRQELRPVVLLVVAVESEVLFKGLVDALRLAITFRVVSRREMKFHVERSSEGAEEM